MIQTPPKKKVKIFAVEKNGGAYYLGQKQIKAKCGFKKDMEDQENAAHMKCEVDEPIEIIPV